MTTRIRGADGYQHITEAPIRIIPKGTFVEIQKFDRGTWDPLYSTPFAVEVEVVPA